MRRASSRFLPPLAGGLSLLLAPAAAMQPGHQPASTSAVDATGTTIKVTNCNDSGPGSLRAAVANAPDDNTTIDLTGLDCRRIGLTSGPIVVPQAVLSLVGPGKNALTVDGNLCGQVIRYENTAGRLRISGMTITRGFKRSNASWPYGGGCIYADYGVLELRNVRVSHCHACGNGARSGRGGGIYANGMVRLFDSEIVDNRATGGIAHGGGIYVNSGLDASRTTFSGNTGGAVTAYGRSVIAIPRSLAIAIAPAPSAPSWTSPRWVRMRSTPTR